MIKPSQEQVAILDTFANTNSDISISAYAGAAKTTSLLMLANANMDISFAYLAFNKDIVDDSKKKMPSNVDCMTLHSAAYNNFAVPHYGSDVVRARLMHGGLKSKDIIKFLGCIPTGRFTLVQTGNLIRKMLNEYLTTDVEDFNSLPFLRRYLDPYGGTPSYAGKEVKQADAYYAANQASKLWDLMIDPDGKTPFTHGVYLKGWQIMGEKYPFPYDAVMLDEAQDANPIMLKVILHNMKHCRKIFVGDENQMIYRWNGCINAMDKLPNAEQMKLTRTYRFGENILKPTNKILKMLNKDNPDMLGLETNGEPFEEDKQFTVLCRTNAEVIQQALFYANKEKKIAINKGFANIYNSLMYLYILKRVGNIRAVYDYIETEGLSKGILKSDYSSYTDVRDIDSELEGGGDHGLGRDWNFASKDDLPDILAKIEASCAKRFSKKVDVFISTTHKAKGLEWDQVVLAPDFRLKAVEPDDKEEWNLNYVALTRAKKAIRAPQLFSKINNEDFRKSASIIFSQYK